MMCSSFIYFLSQVENKSVLSLVKMEPSLAGVDSCNITVNFSSEVAIQLDRLSAFNLDDDFCSVNKINSENRQRLAEELCNLSSGG